MFNFFNLCSFIRSIRTKLWNMLTMTSISIFTCFGPPFHVLISVWQCFLRNAPWGLTSESKCVFLEPNLIIFSISCLNLLNFLKFYDFVIFSAHCPLISMECRDIFWVVITSLPFTSQSWDNYQSTPYDSPNTHIYDIFL